MLPWLKAELGWCHGRPEHSTRRLTCERARFLIKYTARDEVDLLGKGAGGLVEVNESVKAYREPSPLYGFINYRRRKVLLKYVPEGTSRLLQGTLAVDAQLEGP